MHRRFDMQSFHFLCSLPSLGVFNVSKRLSALDALHFLLTIPSKTTQPDADVVSCLCRNGIWSVEREMEKDVPCLSIFRHNEIPQVRFNRRRSDAAGHPKILSHIHSTNKTKGLKTRKVECCGVVYVLWLVIVMSMTMAMTNGE